MGNLTLQGSTSGQITLSPTTVAGTNTLTLPAVTGTVLASSSGTITVPSGSGTAAVQGLSTNIVSGTSVASTSGTSITFTGIPAYAKRITVIFNAVGTSSTSIPQIQVGSGSTTTTGYVGGAILNSSSNATAAVITSGIPLNAGQTSVYRYVGHVVFTLISANTWIASGVLNTSASAGAQLTNVAGSCPTLSGALDRIIITTVNGTDTFAAGSINILYE